MAPLPVNENANMVRIKPRNCLSVSAPQSAGENVCDSARVKSAPGNRKSVSPVACRAAAGSTSIGATLSRAFYVRFAGPSDNDRLGGVVIGRVGCGCRGVGGFGSVGGGGEQGGGESQGSDAQSIHVGSRTSCWSVMFLTGAAASV